MLKYAQVMAWKLFCHFIQTTFHKKSVFSPKKGCIKAPESVFLQKKVSSQAENQRKRGIFYFGEH